MTHTARQLMRFWRSAALSGLQQGSTLSIASSIVPIHVRVESQWRDSGNAEFRQVLGSHSDRQVDMLVEQQSDHETSLGRIASHVSIDFREPPSSITQNTGGTFPGIPLPFQNVSKPAGKVILDDGTILDNTEVSERSEDGLRQVHYHDGLTHLTADKDNDDPPGAYLSVQVPEKVNIECNLQAGGSITIPNKVEGDVRLYTSSGSILVKKLRGHVIELESRGLDSSIVASELLEAQKLKVRTNGRFRAKQIHGSTVDVVVSATDKHSYPLDDDALSADDEGSLVDVSALFVSGSGGATVRVNGPVEPHKRAIRIKTHHGPVQAETDNVAQPKEANQLDGQVYPIVELGGANGSCEISLRETLGDDLDGNWSSCVLHVDSLSLDSVSLVSADKGNISVTLDRKLEADLRMLSAVSSNCLEETGALLAEEEDAGLLAEVIKHLPSSSNSSSVAAARIEMQVSGFTARPHAVSLPHVEYIDGYVENTSHEPDSRFERKGKSDLGSVGKIRLEGAAQQALHGFSREDGTEAADLRPLLAISGTAKIDVESVSWLGAIARRYGLDETGRDLGRTASRRGRALEPSNE